MKLAGHLVLCAYLRFTGCAGSKHPVFYGKAYTYMETGILIGLFLTNAILIFVGSRQRKAFRQTEQQLQVELRQTEGRLQATLLSTERRLQDTLLEKIKEVNLLQHRQQSTLQQTEIRLRDALLEKIEEVEHLLKRYYTSTLFDYHARWWQDYSWLYRHVKDWQCEACNLSLDSDRQYLHTHHLYGTQHNDPNNLKALCIACHSEQPGLNHQRLTATEDYDKFMEEYGAQWRLLKDSPSFTS